MTAAPTATTTTAAPAATTTQPARAAEPTVELTAVISIDLGEGRVRSYVLYVPGGLTEPAPLIVDFHGLTAAPDDQDKVSGMRAAGAANGFVVAQPEAELVANAWDTLEGSPDVDFAIAIVDDVAGRLLIDLDRVYATGFSAGGGLAARLGCDAPDTFAAVAVVAGAHIGHRRCEPGQPVPIIAFYGKDDFLVPYRGFGLLPDIVEWAGDWAVRNGCESEAGSEAATPEVTVTSWRKCDGRGDVILYTVDEGGHGWPGTPDRGRIGDTTDTIDATELMWQFFAARPRS